MEGNAWRELKHPVGEPWHGYRTERDGSGCESNWQPIAIACIGFGFAKFKDVADSAQPDVCAKCARELMHKLLDSIPTANRISIDVTQQL